MSVSSRSPELVFREPHQSGRMAVWGNVVFFVWYGPANEEPIGPMYEAAQEIYKTYERLTSMIIIDEGSTMPDRRLRAAFSKMWEDMKPSGVATVIVTGGFYVSVVKTIMNAIGLMSRTNAPFKSFSDLRSGSLWLSQHSGQAPGQILTAANAFHAGALQAIGREARSALRL